MNTIIVPIIAFAMAKNENRSWFQAGGFADQVFFIGGLNAFVTPYLTYIDFEHLLHQILRWWYCRPEKLLEIHGQEELN